MYIIILSMPMNNNVSHLFDISANSINANLYFHIANKFFILICHAEGVSQFIITRATLIYTSIMAVSQIIRKKVRSGRAIRFEPQYLHLINEYPTIRASLEQVRCMHSYERIKGYNVKLAEHFALNIIGVTATIMRITF
jgi:hypothetical protein